MEWIAIPFALATVAATFAGGALALRLAHSLPTLIALTGGVVVAVALFDVLPEAFENLDDAQRVGLSPAQGLSSSSSPSACSSSITATTRSRRAHITRSELLGRWGCPPTASSTGSGSGSPSGSTPRPACSSSSP